MKFFIYAVCVWLFSSFTLLAEEISSYDIEIKIQENGELLIEERIEYDFKEKEKRGIFRDIPLTIKSDFHVTDLGFYEYSVQMDGKNVAWTKSFINSNTVGKMLRLKIGSSDKYITGKHLYRIQYRVKLGVLPSAQDAQKDAVRWNIIGTGWEVPISNIKAIFKLPWSISKDNVDIATYTGLYGATSSDAHTQWLKARELEVSVESLKAYEGATVEIAFKAESLGQSGKVNTQATIEDIVMVYWHWGALLLMSSYLLILYRRYQGFKDSRAIAVQYTPPSALSLLQAGLILDKSADNDDFSPAILELASLGYIHIKQKNQKTTPVLIRTKKEIKNLSEEQRYLLEDVLFEKSSRFVLTPNTKSKSTRLKNHFSAVNTFLYAWVVKEGYMSENPKILRKRFMKKVIFSFLPILGLLAYTLFTQMGEVALFLMIFPLVFGASGMALILSTKLWVLKLFGLFFTMVGLLPLWLMTEDIQTLESLVFGPVGVVFVLMIMTMIIHQKIGRFTQKGAYHYTHLLGLKMYIQRVKEDEITRNLERDPLHLEKLLPYAILFGAAKHWLSFYEILDISSPIWYEGSSYNLEHFSSSVSRASTPPVESSSSGGFSGGGGSSGGGGGGGGGGSW